MIRRGKVRRAKLYYLRGRRGKAARIVERTDARARRLAAAWKGFKKPRGEAEDLTKIDGISKDLAARLLQLNCMKYEQIANFSDEDIANVDEALHLDGAIEKDDWVGKAQRLIAESTASEATGRGRRQEGLKPRPVRYGKGMPQHIGIVACSAEGAALCYRTICARAPRCSAPTRIPRCRCTRLRSPTTWPASTAATGRASRR